MTQTSLSILYNIKKYVFQCLSVGTVQSIRLFLQLLNSTVEYTVHCTVNEI
jgi:hypothetical protein